MKAGRVVVGIVASGLLVLGSLYCAGAVASSCCDHGKQVKAAKAEVGKPAPGFALEPVGEKATVKLEALQGHIVVVQFYNKDCPWVKGSRDETEAMQQAYKDKGVKFVYVDCTKDAQAEALAEDAQQAGLSVPIVLNTDGAVGRAYGATRTPECYVIDKKGVLRYHGAFDSRGTPGETGETNYVSQAVDALLAGEEVPVKTKSAFGCTIKYPKP